MKKKAKLDIPKLRPHYRTVFYGNTDSHVVEQVFDGDTFIGALLTPKEGKGPKMELIEGAAGQRLLTRLQNELYSKLK